MARTRLHIPSPKPATPARIFARRMGLAVAIALLTAAACSQADRDAQGGVQSNPATVSASSPSPPPAPVAPSAPAPLPDYTGTPCTVLPAIKDPPSMIGKPANDPAYAAIEKAGPAAVPCLVMALVDTRPLDDPQKMPGSQADFTVGDLAFFLLVDFGHVDFVKALPPEVAAKIGLRGAFAYFDWIGVPGSRQQLQARVHEQVAAATVASTQQAAPLAR